MLTFSLYVLLYFSFFFSFYFICVFKFKIPLTDNMWLDIFFFIEFYILCLFIGILHPFKFNVKIDMVRFRAINFSVLLFASFFPLVLPYFGSTEYVLLFHFI